MFSARTKHYSYNVGTKVTFVCNPLKHSPFEANLERESASTQLGMQKRVNRSQSKSEESVAISSSEEEQKNTIRRVSDSWR